MKLYGGIDLHSNNNVIGIIDDNDKMLSNKSLGNDLSVIYHFWNLINPSLLA